MGKNSTTTTETCTSNRVRATAEPAMQMSPETAERLRLIDKAQESFDRANRGMRAIESARNAGIAVGHGMFGERLKIDAAMARCGAAATKLNLTYLRTPATPDLPDWALIHLLRVRVLYSEGGWHEWCAKIRALGGPRMTPRWLFRYEFDHLLGRGKRIDKRVREALILENAHGVVPTGKRRR